MLFKRFVLTSALAAVSLAVTALKAQEMSTDEIRAGIEAQIRANEARSKAQSGSTSRALILNNHQDTVQPLYRPNDVTPPSAPSVGTCPPLNFSNITFEYNSAALLMSSYPQLKNIADAVSSSSYSNLVFQIIGHTDNRGGRDYNQKLSLRRAQSVVAELQNMGVPGNRLRAIGKGMEEPMRDLPGSDALNRRVEIRIC